MRRWVPYKDGRVLIIDQKRIKRCAKELKLAYSREQDEFGVEATYRLVEPIVNLALEGEINHPLEKSPYNYAMKERELPQYFEAALLAFLQAAEGRPAIYSSLSVNEFFDNRDAYIKETDAGAFIFEDFEE